MKIIQKIKWIIGLSLVFIVVLGTNLLDRRNFKKIRHSIITIYEDRLVAKSMVYEMNELVHQKNIAAIKNDSTFFAKRNLVLQGKMDSLFVAFTETKLTPFEKTVVEILSREIAELKKYEVEMTKGNSFSVPGLYAETIAETKKRLRSLADIQMKEGNRLFNSSEDILRSMQVHTQVEMYFLVAMAILIQVIILIKPKD
ncbi:MAG: MCP four helix bundle domain-containing protein [Bacteroidia bacterium]